MSIQNWYANQTPREQIIVAVTALVAVGALLYLLVIDPLRTGIAARESSIAAQKEDLQWMKQQAALVRPGQGGSNAKKPLNKPPYLLLDDAITVAKIKKPDRVTPDGGQGAKAQFSSVEFDKLLQVLGGLEQSYGLTVKTMNVSKKDEGLVSARLSLEVEQ
jgi:type II secretory pathway component PulM